MRSTFARSALWLGGVSLVIVASIVFAVRQQSTAPALPLRHTFDRSTDSWVAFGEGAQVRITTKASDVKTGSGALELQYEIRPGSSGSTVLPIDAPALRQMRALRFWIKADLDTAIAVVLSEAAGGYYSAWFWVPRNRWQRVELFPTDFTLNEGPDEPLDPNNRLDPDRIQAVGIIDLGQFFGLLSQDKRYPLVLNTATGTHYIHLDDVEVMHQSDRDQRERRDVVGDPARGLITWITLGGAELEVMPAPNPLNAAAFQATYTQAPGKYVLLTHGLRTADMSQAAALKFSIASAAPATLVVYLEERSPGEAFGPRYLLTTTLAGGSVPQQKALILSEFAHDTTGPADPDGRLTPNQLKSISFIDITAAESERSQQNTLWFSPIEAGPR